MSNPSYPTDSRTETIPRILARLTSVRSINDLHWRADCPCCGSKNQAVAITLTPKGKVLLQCFAGCKAAEILGSIGLGLRDLYPQSPAEAKAGAKMAKQRSDLRALQTELHILLTAVYDRLEGRCLTAPDQQRESLALSRISRLLRRYHESR